MDKLRPAPFALKATVWAHCDFYKLGEEKNWTK